MNQISYSRVKTTGQLFFQRKSSTVTILEDRIKVGVPAYLYFCNTYKIKSIHKENSTSIIYKTFIVSSKDPDDEFSEYLPTWYIYFSKLNSKMMLYDDNQVGIILKV